MRKVLVVLALLLAGCAPNPADQVPAARVESPPPATAPAETPAATPAGAESPAAGQRFTVDPANSKIAFTASKVTRSHEGGFEKFTGEIAVVDGDPTKSSVRVEIDVDSITTDAADLTDHLKSPDFFDVKQFPTATFTSTAIAQEGEQLKVSGDLTMHGVTKQVSFPATIDVQADKVTARAEFSINRKDWGIVYPGKPDDLIRDEVVLKLDVAATPAP